MSGAGRDTGGLNAGTTGSGAMGDRGVGSAEVHTGLHSGGTEAYSGLQFAGHEEQGTGTSRLRGVADAVRDRIPEGVRNLGSRASSATSGARQRLSGVNDRATGLLESRGLLDRLRDNPLPVLGVAFALGFLLSGRDDDDDDFEPTRASRARRELRTALMAGVTAGIAQGARGFLGQASSEGGSFLTTLLDNLTGGQGDTEPARRAGGQPGRSARSTGGSYGGSTGGSRARSSGGGTAGRSGTYSGGSTGRPPSHQEY